MRTLLSCLGVSLLLASPLAALAQSAEDPNKLRVEIGDDEGAAAASLQQDTEGFVGKAERSLGDELQRDVAQFQELRADASAESTPSTVPTVDDSNASIERDIESLESQAQALGPTK